MRELFILPKSVSFGYFFLLAPKHLSLTSPFKFCEFLIHRRALENWKENWVERTWDMLISFENLTNDVSRALTKYRERKREEKKSELRIIRHKERRDWTMSIWTWHWAPWRSIIRLLALVLTVNKEYTRRRKLKAIDNEEIEARALQLCLVSGWNTMPLRSDN